MFVKEALDIERTSASLSPVLKMNRVISGVEHIYADHIECTFDEKEQCPFTRGLIGHYNE